MGNTIPTYKDPYEEKLKGYLQQIDERKPFQYDVGSDALYQQLLDNYEQQGKLAMEDTMGKAAAMTGGYGNSYAQTVGQQVYSQHMQQLNDTVPDLYGMALDRYQQEGQDLRNKYDFFKSLSDESYNKYLLENGLVSGGTVKYETPDQNTRNTWLKKAGAAENWNDIMGIVSDARLGGYNLGMVVDEILSNVDFTKVKPTKDELYGLADKMRESGATTAEVDAFLGKWGYLIAPNEKPYPGEGWKGNSDIQFQ